MTDWIFCKRLGCFLVFFAGLMLIVSGIAYYSDAKSVDEVLNHAEEQLADISTNLFGGYQDISEATIWTNPVVTMNDKIVMNGTNQTLSTWLNTASSAHSDAYFYRKNRKNFKSKVLAKKAEKIYACINSIAALERAEQELTAASHNVFGGFKQAQNQVEWIKPVYSLDTLVTLDGKMHSVKKWLEIAGRELNETYTYIDKMECFKADITSKRAVAIYDGLNRNVERPTEFWKLNPLAMKE